MSDISIVFYTANVIPESFANKIRDNLLKVKRDAPLISVSHKPMDFGTNIVVDFKRHHLNIYRQALIGAKAATTKYIALAEDDILYSEDHFKYRPKSGVFAYNMSVWTTYTWSNPPMFSYKDRRNLSMLISERDLFINAMNERFEKHPDDDNINLGHWAEPGKYEGPGHLNVRENLTEKFYTDVPNIAFSHETALSYNNLGKRKKLGYLKAIEIPYWGRAEELIKIYG